MQELVKNRKWREGEAYDSSQEEERNKRVREQISNFGKNKGEKHGCQAMAEDSYGYVWGDASGNGTSEHTDSSG